MVGSSRPCVLAVYTPPFLSPHPPLNTESGPTSTWGRERERERESGRKRRRKRRRKKRRGSERGELVITCSTNLHSARTRLTKIEGRQ